ncbi:hypothetical protein [Streptomyces sp. NPDC058240]|uniref:hypothetical protein n=1 Tax=Streptomyces sp. NPDC058240 TaxID=3346396 RepID=UPI0036E8E713
MTHATDRPGQGRGVAIPAGFYAPSPTVVLPKGGGSLVVRFVGEDGRERDFRFCELPLPGLHQDFALALATRIGPTSKGAAVDTWNWNSDRMTSRPDHYCVLSGIPS